jgi:thiamine-monophosphate kinase
MAARTIRKPAREAEAGDEFERIRRYFAPLAEDFPGALGLTDDAALLTSRPGEQLAVTTDALVAGVHFFGDEPASLIARKALRVNLSDLASMGAAPMAYTLALALPADRDEPWLADFAAGLGADQAEFGIHLAGGDSVSTPGALTVSITAFGTVAKDRALRRNGAVAGDLVYVSGTIGDGALGLVARNSGLGNLPRQAQRDLIARYELPQPRVKLGQALAGIAHAAIDISDGLVADLGHIAHASSVRIVVDWPRVPLSPPALLAVAKHPERRDIVLGGGDDYELAFTVSPDQASNLRAIALSVGVMVTEVGRVEAGAGVSVLDQDGGNITPLRRGWRHFGG